MVYSRKKIRDVGDTNNAIGLLLGPFPDNASELFPCGNAFVEFAKRSAFRSV
jgi:hypothetical protein